MTRKQSYLLCPMLAPRACLSRYRTRWIVYVQEYFMLINLPRVRFLGRDRGDLRLEM